MRSRVLIIFLVTGRKGRRFRLRSLRFVHTCLPKGKSKKGRSQKGVCLVLKRANSSFCWRVYVT